MNSHQKEVDTLRYLHPQWAYYYGESVRSFRSQKNVYKSSIEHIDFDCPSVLAPDQPKRFVLGGFHPYNGTPEDFKRFCSLAIPTYSGMRISKTKIVITMAKMPSAN